MKTFRVAIAGFGSVGRAVADLLLSRRERYRRIYDVDVRLVAICTSRAGLLDGAGIEATRFAGLEPGYCGEEFIAASGADVLIEAGPSDFRTGGPALSYLRSSLSAGRDVIVTSKGALVFDGRGLIRLADASGALLKISGATGAALPAIDLLDYNLRGCAVLRIEGILNATTNYLLDAMMTRGIGFQEALQEAQAGGFAERDPSNDTGGWDTACKLLILANFGLGLDLSIDDVAIEGIDAIGKAQIDRWRGDGVVPKLVGSLRREGEKVSTDVRIRVYPQTNPFASVSGKAKAIRVETDTMGEIIALGCGTEPTATASAALKDLEHILQARGLNRRAFR
jgi:homoserine dehydrogenase